MMEQRIFFLIGIVAATIVAAFVLVFVQESPKKPAEELGDTQAQKRAEEEALKEADQTKELPNPLDCTRFPPPTDASSCRQAREMAEAKYEGKTIYVIPSLESDSKWFVGVKEKERAFEASVDLQTNKVEIRGIRILQ